MEYESYWTPHSLYYHHPCPYAMHAPYCATCHMERQEVRSGREIPLQENTIPVSTDEMNQQMESKMIQQFMNDDGQVDIQKMLQTVGQFADTVQQVSPVIKQLNDLVRSFRTT